MSVVNSNSVSLVALPVTLVYQPSCSWLSAFYRLLITLDSSILHLQRGKLFSGYHMILEEASYIADEMWIWQPPARDRTYCIEYVPFFYKPAINRR